MRFRIPIFSGGLNEIDRPDLIGDNELVECTNYIFTKKATLDLRQKADDWDEEIAVNAITHNMDRIWVWKPSFLPKYASSDKDYVIVLYDAGGNLWLLNWDGDEWVSAFIKGEESMPLFTELSEPRIAQTDYGIVIVDGRNNNYTKYIEIRNDGSLAYGEHGIKPPLSITQVSGYGENNNYVDIDSPDVGMGIPRGMVLFVAYTTVTDTGEESNPSPLMVYDSLNYIYLTDDFEFYKYWQKTLIQKLRTVYADMSLGEEQNTKDRMKYFNIYMAYIPYTEGLTPKTELRRVARMPIADIDDDNAFVSSSPMTGNLISYENDHAVKGDDVAYTGGVLFIANANRRIEFPFDFETYFEIKLRNPNSRNYVNAPIWIRIDDINLRDEDGDIVFTWEDVSVGDAMNPDALPHLRFINNDLTTMLPAIYLYSTGNSYIDVMVKIPYMAANTTHNIYLCFGAPGVPEPTGNKTNFRTPKYGRWVDIRDLAVDWSINDQYVLRPHRVRSFQTLLSASCEYHPDDEVPNRADNTNYLEFTDSAEISWMNRVGMYNVFLLDYHLRLNMPTQSTDDNNVVRIAESGSEYIKSHKRLKHNLSKRGYVSLRFGLPALNNQITEHRIFTLYQNDSNWLRLMISKQTSSPHNFEIWAEAKKDGATATTSGGTVEVSSADELLVHFSWEQYGEIGGVTGKVFIFVHDLDNNNIVSGEYGLEDIPFLDDVELRFGQSSVLESIPTYQCQMLMERGYYINNEDDAERIGMFLPYFPEEHVGYKDGENRNTYFEYGKEIKFDTRQGMVSFSNVGGHSMPALNYVYAQGRVTRIHPAPSFMRDRDYMNTLLIFSENFRQRLLLTGNPGNWQAILNEILIDEQHHYGLSWQCRDTLLLINDALYWLSGEKFMRQGHDGLQTLNMQNGMEKVNIPFVEEHRYLAFYNSITNQIIIATYVPPSTDPIDRLEQDLQIMISGHCVQGNLATVVFATTITAWGYVEYWKVDNPEIVYDTRSEEELKTETQEDWEEGELYDTEYDGALKLTENSYDGYRLSPITEYPNILAIAPGLVEVEIEKDEPAGTSVVTEVSLDGGGTWVEVNNGDMIGQIGQQVTSIQTKQTMTTEDNEITPSIGKFNITIHYISATLTQYHEVSIEGLDIDSAYQYKVIAFTPGGQQGEKMGCIIYTGDTVIYPHMLFRDVEVLTESIDKIKEITEGEALAVSQHSQVGENLFGVILQLGLEAELIDKIIEAAILIAYDFEINVDVEKTPV